MKLHLAILRAVAGALDQIDVAVCIFDSGDRTQLWNETFLKFFPEHAGRVFKGEHYCDNLRRFYQLRLSDKELPSLEQYVSEGLQRHRNQQRSFEFNHYDFRVRVVSVELAHLGRIRVWRKTQALPTMMSDLPGSTSSVRPLSLLPETAEALESIADGIMMVDAEDRVLWVNRHFREMYGLLDGLSLVDRRFEDIYAAAWRGQQHTADFLASQSTQKERQRFSGAAYELALPQGRWVRVIEMRGMHADGRSFFSHIDITAMKRQQEELRLLTERLASLAVTDALTGLANRRRFDEAMDIEWRRAARDSSQLALLMIDVDCFKHINDTYGHPFGDLVLQKLAQVLTETVRRAGDLPARYGGEEFVLLLPNTELNVARAIAESIREQVHGMHIGNEKTGALHISISIGVSCARHDAIDTSAAILVDRADAALYQSKRLGRNKVTVG